MTAALDPDTISVLRRLQTARRPGFLATVVSAFRGDAAGCLDALQAALDAGDADAAIAATHALKGAAASVGAFIVGEAAARVEGRARAGDLETASAALPELHGAHRATMEALEALLDDVAQQPGTETP